MIDLKKVKEELVLKHLDSSKDDEGYDDFLDATLKYAKELSFADKVEYATKHPEALAEALLETEGKNKVEDLLTEMIFMQLSF